MVTTVVIQQVSCWRKTNKQNHIFLLMPLTFNLILFFNFIDANSVDCKNWLSYRQTFLSDFVIGNSLKDEIFRKQNYFWYFESGIIWKYFEMELVQNLSKTEYFRDRNYFDSSTRSWSSMLYIGLWRYEWYRQHHYQLLPYLDLATPIHKPYFTNER